MEIVIDTSALISVILHEPERNRIIEVTSGCVLLGPGSIPWEIGNAFSAMFKQNRLSLHAAKQSLKIYSEIPIRLMQADYVNVLQISKKTNMYAYDAYMMDIALRFHSPLLTLDQKLKRAATKIDIKTIEV